MLSFFNLCLLDMQVNSSLSSWWYMSYHLMVWLMPIDNIIMFGYYTHPVDLEPMTSPSILFLQEEDLPLELEFIGCKWQHNE